MSDILVTLDQLREIVKVDKIKPEDIFEADALKHLKEEGRAEGYADARITAAREMSTGPTPAPKVKAADAPKEDPDRYLDPAKNPMIRLSREQDGEEAPAEVDPAKNSFIKLE